MAEELQPGTIKPAEWAVSRIEAAADFLSSRYIEAVIEHSVQTAVLRSQSPWLDRESAATHCRCSVSEIDRAAKAMVFKTHYRSGTPMFWKEDLNKAIAEGRWKKRG